ncbi:MAG: phage BR0599 family protein, partial [Parasphingorhabdus sp.]
DRQCKLSLYRYQREGRILSVDGDSFAVEALGDAAPDFAFGSLRFLDGPNCGLSYAIIDGEAGVVRLAHWPAQTVTPGTRVLLTEGCNKNFATCRDRFANSINFRGEPYLPGNDLLTRYPGA